MPPASPGGPIPQAPQSANNQSSPLKQIRTFQGDVAEALSSQHESLYSLQAKEHARRPELPLKEGERKVVFFVGGLLLIALTLVGGWYTYTEYIHKTTPPPVALPQSRFFAAEKETTLDTSRLAQEALIEAVNAALIGTKGGEVRHAVLRAGSSTAPETSAANFFGALGASAPSALVRALGPTFMLGSLGGAGGESRFIVFRLVSYENAFAGMLAWEPTLAADLGPLFATSEGLKTIPPASVFTDTVSRNKDVRVLADAAGNPLLLYSFLDRQDLIITDSLATLSAVIDRLTREKLAR